MGPHWDAKRKLIDAHYVGMEPGPPLFKPTVRHDLSMTKDMTIDDLLGYIRTWSAYNTFMRVTGTARDSARDPVVYLRARLAEVYGGVDPAAHLITVRWPVFLLLAEKA